MTYTLAENLIDAKVRELVNKKLEKHVDSFRQLCPTVEGQELLKLQLKYTYLRHVATAVAYPLSEVELCKILDRLK